MPKTEINDNLYINKIYNSKQLYINDFPINKEYINYIRGFNYINGDNNKIIKNNISKEIMVNLSIYKERYDKYKNSNFLKLCVDEELIEINQKEFLHPKISVILPCYNKEDVLMKSVRSIQNQSFKNIEIIIVDDCSTDNTTKYYKYLLESDPRIRIFTHIKNMGVWRSRIDGFLYSRGKYVIHFDPGDLYSDRFVLEDAFNIIEKYNLDSIKMIFIYIFNYKTIQNEINIFPNNTNPNSNINKIIYNSSNIKKYNEEIFSNCGVIWNRLTKSCIFTKGLYLLDSNILNAYKNLWEDLWWNQLANEVSNNLLIINRVGYLYYKDNKGEGNIKTKTLNQKNKIIQEFIYFLYFNYILYPDKDNINKIINKLYYYSSKKNNSININYLSSNFKILKRLLFLLIKNPLVKTLNKKYLKKLLINIKKKEKKENNKKKGDK